MVLATILLTVIGFKGFISLLSPNHPLRLWISKLPIEKKNIDRFFKNVNEKLRLIATYVIYSLVEVDLSIQRPLKVATSR